MRAATVHASTSFYAVSLIGVTLAMAISGCDRSESTPRDELVLIADTDPQAPTSDTAVRDFCGDCHLLPRSSSFAKDRWHKEVQQGFNLYVRSGRQDLVKPNFVATVAFFANGAPDALTFAKPQAQQDTVFRKHEVLWGEPDGPIAVSHVRTLSPSASGVELAMTDIWSGDIYVLTVDNSRVSHRVIGDVAHASHLAPADFNNDKIADYVVADLGTFNPEGADQASLWLFQGNADGTFLRHALRLGLSRMSCVRVVDYDADGDTDIVAGDFGMHFTGAVYLLTNQGNKDAVPDFQWTVLDGRPGVIDTPIVDLNGDERADIVTLISQHHETIEVHLNLGHGVFERHTIFRAPDPSYGSSGIEVLDMDGDDDLDILYTNGDTFDDALAKPYHAIRWLENKGSYPFAEHLITSMPGVYAARGGDIDLDGDVDIAAVALLGVDEIGKQPQGTFDGVIWLEQTESGEFIRHTIKSDVCDAATCHLVDWDRDGDLDLFVPPYQFDRTSTDRLTVYLNQSR